MVDFSLTPEQTAWREKARAFARAHVLPRVDLDQHGVFPWELYRGAFDEGFITACLPTSVGGGGRPLLDVLLATEELAYGDLGVATSIGVLTLASSPLVRFGTADQQQRWLAPLCRELGFASFAWTEPEGSTNLFGRPATTTAREVPGGFVLNGVKSTITNGSVARLLTVFARLDSSAHGLSCFVLSSKTPGVEARNPYRKMGQRASDTGEITFRDVFVPSVDFLGKPGQGQQIAVHSMTRSRVGICAMALGVARRAKDLVVEYGHTRTTAAGQKLIEQQDYRLRIAELDAEIETIRALCWRAAWEVEHGLEGSKLASVAKLMGGNMAVRVTNEATELLGATGYLESGKAEKLLRDAKVLQIYEGPQFVQKTVIADTAIRLSRVGKA
ncbi:MAG: acyl-CoA dehydrogenase family protein [Archangium sp.]|nr:acyl-CoA dehydrogenase family protein [Archangium sp.]